MKEEKRLNNNIEETARPQGDSRLIPDDEIFLRMNLAERLQHIFLIITFTVLVLTGLPVFFYELKLFKWLFPAQNSFYIRGIAHRVAAVLFIINLVWHLLYTALTSRGRKNFVEIFPKFKDFKDAFEVFLHHLGITRFLYRRGIFKKFFEAHPYWLFENPPLYGRYNFIEKFEYWAVGWGAVVMIISGFFMWKVEFSLSLFPLWVHDIFVIVHGYEAILAFLAVIIWHMYNVHFNPEDFPMSRIWIDGKITGKKLRILHPLEYKKILEEREKAINLSKT